MYLFNAKIETPEKLEQMLVGREQIVSGLVDAQLQHSLGGMPPQYLAIGPRGSGKTHILRVIYDRLSKNHDYMAVHEIAYMVEDETGIGSYFDLLQRMLEALKRWSTDEQKAKYIFEQLEQLKESYSKDWTKNAEKILLDLLKDKTLLVLIENFDSIMRGMDMKDKASELAKLRDFIQQHNQISFIATSQALIHSLSDNQNPLYGFFQVVQLKRLTLEESYEFIKKLAATENNEDLLQFLETPDGKGHLEAIHQFTKGNHRLLLVFLDFLKAEFRSNLSEVFLKSIDELKPYYDSFIKSLSPQQQKIVQYLALQRNPQKGVNIGRNCFLDKSIVSKQISELQRLGYVNAVNEKGRDKYYEISEPLLRMCIEINEDRNGIIKLFVNFLGKLYTAEQLKEKYLHYTYLERFQPETTQKLYQAEAKFYSLAKSQYLRSWVLSENEKRMLSSCNEPNETKKMIIDLSHQEQIIFAPDEQINHFFELKEWDNAIRIIQKQIVIEPNNATHFNLLGYALVSNEQYDKAIDAFREAIELNPKSANTWYNLGYTFVKEREFENAINSYLKAIQINPNDASTWNDLGNSYIEIKKIDNAIEAFTNASKIEPKDAFILGNLGIAYSELKEYTKAILCLKKATALNPTNEMFWFTLATLHFQNNQYNSAIISYLKASEINPNNYEIWSDLGLTYFKLREFDKAIETCKKAIELKPNNATVWSNIGTIYDNLDQFDKAINYYQKAIEIQSDNYEAWYNLGTTSLKMGEFEKASKAFRKSIEIKPDSVEAWTNLGNTFGRLHQYEKAIEAIKRAIEIEPNSEIAWLNIGNIYSEIKENDKAINAFLSATKINPSIYKAWLNLGFSYNKNKLHEKAIEAYKKAIKIKPDEMAIWNNLSLSYLITNQYENAIATNLKAIDINPNYALSWFNLGNAYSASNRTKEAVEAFQKATEIKPNESKIWNNLGISYFKSDLVPDAKKSFLKAISNVDINDSNNEILAYYFNLLEVLFALTEIQESFLILETVFSISENLYSITEFEDAMFFLIKNNSETDIKRVFIKVLKFSEYKKTIAMFSAFLSNLVFGILREKNEVKPFRLEMLKHLFEELFSNNPEFTYPLRFLDIGFRYFIKGEKEAIYEMSQEERLLFEKSTSIGTKE